MIVSTIVVTLRYVKWAVAVVIVAAVYVAAGKVGLSFATVHENVSFIWPPAGFALAALLIGGYRLWPGIFFGALVVNALTDIQWHTTIAIASGNTLEALLGTFLLRDVLGLRNGIDRLRDVLGLIFLGGLVSTTVAATLGTTSLCLEGSAPWSLFPTLWFEWWIGDMLGILVLSPFLLTWSSAPRVGPKAFKSIWKVLEALALSALLVLVVEIFLGKWIEIQPMHHPRSYLLFPLLIWAAIRFGPKGASAATLAIFALTLWGNARGFGPLAEPTAYQGLLFLQLFMAALILTALVLAATISERKRSEEVKSEFASMVSHELRTPLSSIKAGIDIVLDGIDGSVTQAQAETLGIAKNNVARLTRLINNVLDYSKLESGKMEMVFERTDMSQLMRETSALMKSTVEGKVIDFRTELPPEPLFAVCDGDKIKQVLINLLNNAIKFTDDGGAIISRLRNADHYVVIEVEDTGIGIKKEDQDRIFEMFSQASPPEGNKLRRGSGIGLAVCRLIIHHHKGLISVRSQEERGSRFTATFPDSLPERKKTITLR